MLNIHNGCDPKKNGELKYFLDNKYKFKLIFDVGCRYDSLFQDFEGEVHYFDPVKNFIDKLKSKPNKNILSYYNVFGLSDTNSEQYYFPRYQSFVNRTRTCGHNDEKNKILLKLKKARDYIINNNIKNIDFLKIDTEGFEFDVIKGFEDQIQIVKCIQFEYGGTFIDRKIKMADIIQYLKDKNFINFYYLTPTGKTPLVEYKDHYRYCNVVCER